MAELPSITEEINKAAKGLMNAMHHELLKIAGQDKIMVFISYDQIETLAQHIVMYYFEDRR